MATFPDLTPYIYATNWTPGQPLDPTVVNIGWLDPRDPHGAHYDFSTLLTTLERDAFLPKLKALVDNHVQVLMRGSHVCPCGTGATSNGEIRVRHDGITYAAPQMIYHYVTIHDYCPPEQFRAAVLLGESEPWEWMPKRGFVRASIVNG